MNERRIERGKEKREGKERKGARRRAVQEKQTDSNRYTLTSPSRAWSRREAVHASGKRNSGDPGW